MCYQVLKHTHASLDSQPRQSTLHSYPYCLAWCGTAALEERHYRSASLPYLSRGTTATQVTVGGWGYLYPSPSFPTVLYLFFLTLAHPKQRRSSLSSSIVDLKSQANSLISPSILERKRCQTRLESGSTDS